ncbi:MAG: hypothetical protein ACI9JN_001363, partial [Bacteroidia bacterium]
YYSRSKTFFFKDSVELVNPEYRMKSDTLSYNTISKIAYFYGPTYIYSDENTIFCRYGWYNTIANTSEFSRGVWIQGEDNKLITDSLLYNRNTGIGQAFRNITLIDTIEQIRIEGDYGISYRLIGRTMVTGSPLAIKYFEDDSLFVKSDTLIDQVDTVGNRRLLAYYNTKIYKNDLQGIADSLIYSFSDSTISMMGSPILWTEENQITGDTLIVFRRNGQLHKLEVINEAFIVSYVQPEIFNQIDGTDMTAFFKNNKLSQVKVEGNGQSVYYVQDDDSAFTGVNHMVCSDMLITVDDNTVSDVRYYDSPKGGFYPVTDFPTDKKKLPNFIWLPDNRPALSYFMQDRLKKEAERPESVKDLFSGSKNMDE